MVLLVLNVGQIYGRHHVYRSPVFSCGSAQYKHIVKILNRSAVYLRRIFLKGLNFFLLVRANRRVKKVLLSYLSQTFQPYSQQCIFP